MSSRRALIYSAVVSALIVTSCGRGIAVQETSTYNYEEVNNWSISYENCNGLNQSPVNIDLNDVSRRSYPPIIFGNYNKKMTLQIYNNGRKIKLEAKAKRTTDLPYIRAGGLPAGKFIYAQMHFHWGFDSGTGSEHLIQSQSYPAELHIVHYNANYGSLEKAVNHRDGLAVLAVLFEETEKDNGDFEPIIDSFDQVGLEGMKVDLSKQVQMMDFLPNTESFFRYTGSLTTPTCQEAVTWTIFDSTISLSRNQLDRFRSLFNKKGRALGNNFRPAQKINGRKIFYRSGKSRKGPMIYD